MPPSSPLVITLGRGPAGVEADRADEEAAVRGGVTLHQLREGRAAVAGDADRVAGQHQPDGLLGQEHQGRAALLRRRRPRRGRATVTFSGSSRPVVRLMAARLVMVIRLVVVPGHGRGQAGVADDGWKPEQSRSRVRDASLAVVKTCCSTTRGVGRCRPTGRIRPASEDRSGCRPGRPRRRGPRTRRRRRTSVGIWSTAGVRADAPPTARVAAGARNRTRASRQAAIRSKSRAASASSEQPGDRCQAAGATRWCGSHCVHAADLTAARYWPHIGSDRPIFARVPARPRGRAASRTSRPRPGVDTPILA